MRTSGSVPVGPEFYVEGSRGHSLDGAQGLCLELCWALLFCAVVPGKRPTTGCGMRCPQCEHAPQDQLRRPA